MTKYNSLQWLHVPAKVKEINEPENYLKKNYPWPCKATSYLSIFEIYLLYERVYFVSYLRTDCRIKLEVYLYVQWLRRIFNKTFIVHSMYCFQKIPRAMKYIIKKLH